MIDSLSKTQRRLLALLILTLLVGLLFAGTVTPLMSLNTHYLDRIDQLEQRLRILNNKVASGNALRARQSELKKRLQSSGHYLKSNTEALAAADLQGIIKRLSQINRTDVQSTQPLPSIQEDGFSAVVLKVRMRGRLDSLARIFHSLESGKPYLFMNNLSIRSRIQHGRKLNYTGANNDRMLDLVEMLEVEFDITGYLAEKHDQNR